MEHKINEEGFLRRNKTLIVVLKLQILKKDTKVIHAETSSQFHRVQQYAYIPASIAFPFCLQLCVVSIAEIQKDPTDNRLSTKHRKHREIFDFDLRRFNLFYILASTAYHCRLTILF